MKARVHRHAEDRSAGPAGRGDPPCAGHPWGFRACTGVRQGKVIELDLAATDKAAAEAEVKAMCEKLLANTVIESYRVEIG